VVTDQIDRVCAEQEKRRSDGDDGSADHGAAPVILARLDKKSELRNVLACFVLDTISPMPTLAKKHRDNHQYCHAVLRGSGTDSPQLLVQKFLVASGHIRNLLLAGDD
jgi:hypothetical protein